MRSVVVLSILLAAAPASARLRASFSLRAFEGAREAVVATIQEVKVVGQRQLGNQRVETLRIGARVELTFKGGQRGQALTFVHWRARSTGPTFNGFRYPTLVKGRAYLLVLERQGKHLQLIAPEDDIVDVPPRVLRAAIKQHTQPGLAKVVAVLRLRVLFCDKSCGRAIWLLDGAPRAHRIPQKKMVALLLPVARSAKSDANSKLAAYSTLGRLGERRLGQAQRPLPPRLPDPQALSVSAPTPARLVARCALGRGRDAGLD